MYCARQVHRFQEELQEELDDKRGLEGRRRKVVMQKASGRKLKIDTSNIKGFLDEDEAQRLYQIARKASKRGNCLEIGSYCGKSAVYIGSACQENGALLYSIDHHRGSAEQQPGEAYFDSELFDKNLGCVNTLTPFLSTIERFALKETVIPIVGDSVAIAKGWASQLAMVFIDGGHTFAAAYNDYNCWVPKISAGGFLVIHDIFDDPTAGGQAPRWIYEAALASGLFLPLKRMKTLGILRRVPYGIIPKTALYSYQHWQAP